MVLVKKWKSFHVFYLGPKTGQKNLFDDLLERKEAFLGYKGKEFNFSKSRKIGVFSFGQKIKIFHVFLGGQNRPGKCV